MLPQGVADNKSRKTYEPESLQGEGIKIIILSNLNEFWTRLEVLPGLKLSGHTVALPEASFLIDDLNKRGEIQNEQSYQTDLDKFFDI